MGMKRMEEKRMETREMLCAALVLAFFSMSLYGCGKTGQEPGTEAAHAGQEPSVEAVPPGQEQETDSGASLAEGSETELEPGQNNGIAFPAEFNETIGDVTFSMDVIANADMKDGFAKTAKAQMQKVNREKAFQLFFSGIEIYDTYDYEEEDEYGKTAHQVTYVSPEETTLAYGPEASKFDYMKRDLMPYVLNAFVPFQDERYNADLYGTEEQLSFMTREEAFHTILNALKEFDIGIEANYIGYALDHETMGSQEYHEDMDGNIDKPQYKAQWSSADDCYYFYINQTYKGVPLYYAHNEDCADTEDINAQIQAVVSEEGIEWLNIDKVFTVSEEQNGVLLADMDAVVKTAADKCNQILGEAAYEMTKAELYYYVDLASGKGTYDVKPVWILTGSERDGKGIQIIISAQTAEEIVP